jgi:hypothetical protein
MSTTRDDNPGTRFDAEISTINLRHTGDRMIAEVTIRIEEPDDDVLADLIQNVKKPLWAALMVKDIPAQGAHVDRPTTATPATPMSLYD